MRVSYNNYRRMHKFLKPELSKELNKILSFDSDSEYFQYQYKYEKEIGKFLSKRYARGVSSGTTALQFCLTSMGIGPGDEVITTPFTFIASLLAITNTGARPVLADIEPDTYLIDLAKAEQKVTSKTKAIIPVHMYGQMVDMEKVRGLAKKHRLYVIEDACQAHMAKFNGKPPGELSDAACYSFFPNKGLGGISNGGIAVTKHKKIYNDIEKLRNPTSHDPMVLKSYRTPAYLDWLQIAFLKSKMKHYKKWVEIRREIAAKYNESLKDLPVEFPKVQEKAFHVYRDFVIRTKKRDKLKKCLEKEGIKTIVHYPTPCHLSPAFEGYGYKKGDLPESERACDEVLSIPVNPFLEDKEIYYVIDKIKEFVKR